jgi:hypothetical protein
MLDRRLSGPAWLKGIIFANVENVILYPITWFEDIHPAIRDGQVDRYFNWPAFWQSVPRHIAFGAVLGVVYNAFNASVSLACGTSTIWWSWWPR